MAVAFKFGVGDLLPKFLADALIIFAALQTAGTVSTGTLQSFPDGLHHFLIFIQPNCHSVASLLFISLNGFKSLCQSHKMKVTGFIETCHFNLAE